MNTGSQRILNKINSLRKDRNAKEKSPVFVIAVDGRCASGKSTLAAELSSLTGAEVIHMDDFFLPEKLRTAERLAAPGGNVHYERFIEEVLPGLREGKAIVYRRFDCSRMSFGKQIFVPAAKLYVVEGAYSHHPALGKYMDLKVFSDVAEDVQLERILKRGGEEALRSFKERWIPMEEAYFRAYGVKEQADMIIEATEMETE